MACFLVFAGNNNSRLYNENIQYVSFSFQDTYPSFHYTTLLYLNDYGIDFLGGQFKFIEKRNSTSAVQPKKGNTHQNKVFKSQFEFGNFLIQIFDVFFQDVYCYSHRVKKIPIMLKGSLGVLGMLSPYPSLVIQKKLFLILI